MEVVETPDNGDDEEEAETEGGDDDGFFVVEELEALNEVEGGEEQECFGYYVHGGDDVPSD